MSKDLDYLSYFLSLHLQKEVYLISSCKSFEVECYNFKLANNSALVISTHYSLQNKLRDWLEFLSALNDKELKELGSPAYLGRVNTTVKNWDVYHKTSNLLLGVLGISILGVAPTVPFQYLPSLNYNFLLKGVVENFDLQSPFTETDIKYYLLTDLKQKVVKLVRVSPSKFKVYKIEEYMEHAIGLEFKLGEVAINLKDFLDLQVGSEIEIKGMNSQRLFIIVGGNTWAEAEITYNEQEAKVKIIKLLATSA